MSSDADVSGYYDRNTPRFLLVGGGGASHSIHRQLWGPGVRTAEEASNHIHTLVASEIERIQPAPTYVIDMGCGVGGTLFYLAESLPESELLGVTISARQHQIALKLAEEKDLSHRCRFVQEDFQIMEVEGDAQAIVAIESFVHSRSSEPFFRSVERHLADGGLLVIADDFLARDRGLLDTAAVGHVQDFESGWRLGALCTVEKCASSAASFGLTKTKDVDLSPLIRLGRPRDRAISALSPVLRFLGLESIPFFGNMIGGNALQIGLRAGFLEYHLLVFRKG